jgi:predicted DNA-binding transcriptional regulator YafY
VLQTSARLLRLLALLQARRFWTGADLASRLEVSERTVRRDVDRLRSLGYPVDSSSGVAGGYQLGAGATLPPLLLDDDEALAVALGLRTAAAGSVSGVEEAAVRALAKLERVLPRRLRSRVQALQQSVVPLYFTGNQVDAALLTALAGACRDHQLASFRYADGRGRATERSTEPHGLVHTGARWYLVAWDVGREDWRTFRVDRIDGLPHCGARFMPRTVPGGDLGAFVSRSTAAGPYSVVAHVLLHAPLARVRARVPPLAAHLERVDDEHCMLSSGGHSLALVALHVAMIGEEFEVLEPPELVALLRSLAGRLERAAARGGHRHASAETSRPR